MIIRCRILASFSVSYWTFYILYHGVIVNSSFQGKEFLLAFPSSFPTNSIFEQRLSIANSGDLEASINITMSKNSTVLLFQQKTLGVGQGCSGDCVNESLASTQSRLGGIIIRVSSTGRIVVIAHSTSASSEYDNFLALPMENLSLAYSALAECPSNFCVLIIASAARAVNITITFCLASSAILASLKYNNITYFHGSNLNATLDPWKTLEIVTNGVSLSGSLIQSSGKIAVVSGTLTLSNGVITDYNVEEAVPRDQIGTEYVVVDCPTCGKATFVKIVYIELNTNLSIDTKMLVLNTRRDCIDVYTLKNKREAIIRTDKPIIVQLMYSNDNMIVTPTIKWGTYYVTVPSSQSRVILVTRSNCSSEFSFNGLVDNSLSWSVIGDGSFKHATTSIGNYGTWLNVSTINCTFTGTVYTNDKMLWSLGWGPDFVTHVTSSLAATSTYNAGVTQTSTSSSINYIVDTNTASDITTSLTIASTKTSLATYSTTVSASTETSLPTSTFVASSSTETSSISSSTTASTSIETSLPTSTFVASSSTETSSISSSTTASASIEISLPTSTFVASSSKETSLTTSSQSAATSTETFSPKSSSESSTTTIKSSTSSPRFSTTASTATSSPTPTTTTTKLGTSSPTSSTTASTATSSPTSSTTAYSATERSRPKSSTSVFNATFSTTDSTSKTNSATETSTHTEATRERTTSNSSTSLNTPTTPTLSTPIGRPAGPTKMVATAIIPFFPLPDLYVCPCTCSYASFQPMFMKLLRQKENIIRELIRDLKLDASARSAQKMLKISVENQSMSETIVGAAIFILFMAISVSVMAGPDLLRMASYIIKLFRSVAQNFK